MAKLHRGKLEISYAINQLITLSRYTKRKQEKQVLAKFAPCCSVLWLGVAWHAVEGQATIALAKP